MCGGSKGDTFAGRVPATSSNARASCIRTDIATVCPQNAARDGAMHGRSERDHRALELVTERMSSYADAKEVVSSELEPDCRRGEKQGGVSLRAMPQTARRVDAQQIGRA